MPVPLSAIFTQTFWLCVPFVHPEGMELVSIASLKFKVIVSLCWARPSMLPWLVVLQLVRPNGAVASTAKLTAELVPMLLAASCWAAAVPVEVGPADLARVRVGPIDVRAVDPPSGAALIPSRLPMSSIPLTIAVSGIASAVPPLSRTARRIRKSPIARGTRRPSASVVAPSHGCAFSVPC